MKKTRRLLSLLLAGITAVSLFVLSACGTGNTEQEEMTVMNVAVNPQIEFILDGENKVVSVNAINEDGNVILSAEAFVNVIGLDAGDAAKLFIDVCEDYGFIIKGNVKAGENEIDISISGDTKKAEELYNNVKGKVEEFVNANDISATVTDLVNVGKAELEKLLAECAPYLEQAEIEAMKQIDIVKELVASRKETAKMYSQELKNAFYQIKANALEIAEIELLKTKLGAIGQSAIELANKTYTDLVAQIEATRASLLLSADSIYQKALIAYREAKAEYLNFRNYVAGLEESAVTQAIDTTLQSLKGILDSAQTALESAANAANESLNLAKAGLKEAHDAVISIIETLSVKVSDFALEIKVAQEAAAITIVTEFETGFKAFSDTVLAELAKMRTELENGYTE